MITVDKKTIYNIYFICTIHILVEVIIHISMHFISIVFSYRTNSPSYMRHEI